MKCADLTLGSGSSCYIRATDHTMESSSIIQLPSPMRSGKRRRRRPESGGQDFPRIVDRVPRRFCASHWNPNYVVSQSNQPTGGALHQNGKGRSLQNVNIRQTYSRKLRSLSGTPYMSQVSENRGQ
jgi:hypothetical protein